MTNLDIAQKAELRPIEGIAERICLEKDDYDLHGKFKAKLTTEAVNRYSKETGHGKLILVTAITPTPAGEGKTTVSIGLAQGLNKIGKKAIPALREPALGPVFGIKGGACGGGYSQVLPMEDINLFFNGDFPAVTAAHNVLSAILDNSIHNGNPHNIDLSKIWWPRTIDMIDRGLREIVIGLGSGNGPVRSDRFVITPASEIMAILCLSRSMHDLKDRLASIIVGLPPDKKPVTAGDLGAVGSMAALLRDAIRPNLVQTIEGGPAMIHGGPFGNIAHGCSSILGTQCGLNLGDYLVTEGGFGSDLGGEKFLNIVCPALGRAPSAIVLVATVRALKHHGRGDLSVGMVNLGQHISHLRNYGPPLIVTVNRFADDTEAEIDQVKKYAQELGVQAVESNPWMGGGPGCENLASVVAELADKPSTFGTVYDRKDSIKTKLQKLTERVYGGKGVSFAKAAESQITWAETHGYGDLPVCVAKTQNSLSDDATLLGAPKDFELHVRDLKLSAGAGFLVAICGDIMLMPGMGKTPAALRIDVDDAGIIHGLN